MATTGASAPASTEAAMEEMLKAIGVEHYEPRMLAALSECAKRYTAEVLADAKDYAAHRHFPGVAVEDVKLALQTHPSTHAQVWRQSIRELATDVNRQDLPLIPDLAGIREPVVGNHFVSRSLTVVAGPDAFPDQHDGAAQVPMAISGPPQTQTSSHASSTHAPIPFRANGSASGTAPAASPSAAPPSAAAPATPISEDDQPNKRFRMELNK